MGVRALVIAPLLLLLLAFFSVSAFQLPALPTLSIQKSSACLTSVCLALRSSPTTALRLAPTPAAETNYVKREPGESQSRFGGWCKAGASLALASSLILPAITQPLPAHAKTELPSLEKIFNAVRKELSPEGIAPAADDTLHSTFCIVFGVAWHYTLAHILHKPLYRKNKQTIFQASPSRD